ncbi:hypothetical protein ICE98_02621 [Lactococcus lactis]|nr:hypothetical protein [Lactococcus lactis]
MNKNLKEFLPIGSVVLVAGGKEKLMIIGQKQIEIDTKREFDYSAVLFPDGYKDELALYHFNREEVVYIFQMGFYDN